ncbi:UNVERIFIED_CONTAM: hypothetical protein PYX00_001923 [Menopon gallinae]|uniref:Methylosome protein 50 n=1 Tax=Menopon gallinae TaxID=328185 RepID=A0AAW2IFW5_9NEOP
MQPDMYQQEPNLLAQTYRNHVVQLPRRFEKQYDFIDINKDGTFLLGTSNMTGRIWCGSVWLFNDMSDPPDVEKCIAGLEFESGVAVCKWYENGTRIAVGTDFGALNLLSLAPVHDVKRHYLSTLAILSEHDDCITTLDPTFDGNKILTGSMDMNIKIWDTDSATCEKTYECAHTHTVTSACFQPGKDDVFISTSTDGNSLLWDRNLEKPASLILRTESGYSACCWVNENCIALGANSGSVSLVDLRMKSELDRNFCSQRPIFYLNYDKETELLAVSADDPIVRVFHCTNNLLNNVYECERHHDFVRGLAWKSPYHLYSCAWDSKILHHEVKIENTELDCSKMDVNGISKTVKDEEEKI